MCVLLLVACAGPQAPEGVAEDPRAWDDFFAGSTERRVVGKAERLEKGANPRFVVTSIRAKAMKARSLHEDFYCGRGDMENRIKEQQLGLFADRTSSSWMRSNQLRL